MFPLDLKMENDENNIKLGFFSMILKNLRVTFYWWMKTFFLFAGKCSVERFKSIFFRDSQG